MARPSVLVFSTRYASVNERKLNASPVHYPYNCLLQLLMRIIIISVII